MYGGADLNAGFLRTDSGKCLNLGQGKTQNSGEMCRAGDSNWGCFYKSGTPGLALRHPDSREGKQSMARTHCGSPAHILWSSGQNSTVGLFSASEPVTLGQDRPRAEASLHPVPKPPVLGPNSILAGFCVATSGSAQGAFVLAALLALLPALHSSKCLPGMC